MKKIVIAVDGGGSKTHCVLVNDEGIVLAKKEADGTNHQLCGIQQASSTLCDLVNSLAEGIGGDVDATIVMGLAGMDFDRDVSLMTGHLKGFIANSPEILNDIWIALAAGGIQDGYGAVSICGTGHNTGVLTKDGTRYGISALKYPLGNFGGGNMLAESALHKAFRSYEKTGEYTSLEASLPVLCNTENMEDLLLKIYESNYEYHRSFGIPRLVDSLAMEGDKICRELLQKFGRTQGEITGRLIVQADLQNEPVSVVMAGSLYTRRQTDLMIDSFEKSVKEYCPCAILEPLDRPPVLGAAMLGLRRIHKGLSKKDATQLMANMDRTLGN